MTYHYKSCGLDYVYLLNGYEEKETPYGSGVSFRAADKLDNVLASMVVATPGRLRGQEVRFIRSMLDLSQKQLADRLGVSRVTVARWEGKSSTPIPGAADRLLRMIYAIEMFTADGVEHVYSMLTEISGPLPERMEMVYAAASSEEEPELFDNNGGGPTWTKKAA